MHKYQINKKININSVREFSKILDIDKDTIIKNFKNCKNYYFQKTIEKKDKSLRTLFIPNKSLKNIQTKIYKNILIKIPLSSCVHGGIKKHSIITNASCHVGKDWVINIDLCKFFDNIHYSRILKVFCGLGCNDKISKILTGLTTHKHCLPQGAPTSPYLSNLVLINLDKRFVFLCEKNKTFYTRYFDDITISGNKLTAGKRTKENYYQIIKEEGYKVNHKKTKEYYKNKDQLVNGILVNKKLMPNNNFIKKLEDDIESLINFGIGFLEDNCLFKERESLIGKIKFLNSFDKQKSKKLRKKLDLIDWKF